MRVKGSDSMKERVRVLDSHTARVKFGYWIRAFGFAHVEKVKEGNQKMPATGARPMGAMDEAGAATAVRQMFDSIAPRYDLLNHLLSANVDRLWWRKAARRFAEVLARPEAAVLDICCGTGDLTMALLKLRPRGARPILAGDFAPAMLRRGAEKFGPKESHGANIGSTNGSAGGAPYAVAIEADALHLPLRAESLDLIVTAFGFRNLANYEAGLKEFYRVLKPGGQLGILEFSEPEGLVGKAYGVYFRRVLPAIGRVICGKTGAYNYLPTSVGNFPRPGAMVEMMRRAGFEECAWQPYTFGIAGLYTAERPAVV
jgi:demethylmenaquinone methyltransferase/2-methoxy-6-polyprenyl-1,4-benzoquinol methylase